MKTVRKAAARPTPEERARARAAGLVALARAAADCFGGTHMPDLDPLALRHALRDLRDAALAVPGAYVVIVGGLAVQELGYERYTRDIDAVVDSAHFEAVLAGLRERGFEITPGLFLKNRLTGVELDLLREGATPKGSLLPLPHPRELGPSLGFATLPGLLRLKLAAGRMQDQADIVALLKSRLDEVESLAAQMPPAVRKDLHRLAAEARREAER